MQIVLVVTLMLLSLRAYSFGYEWISQSPRYIEEAISANMAAPRIFCAVGEGYQRFEQTYYPYQNCAVGEGYQRFEQTYYPYQNCLEEVCGSKETGYVPLVTQEYDSRVDNIEQLKQSRMGLLLSEKIQTYYKEDSSVISDEDKKKYLEMAETPLEHIIVDNNGAMGFLIFVRKDVTVAFGLIDIESKADDKEGPFEDKSVEDIELLKQLEREKLFKDMDLESIERIKTLKENIVSFLNSKAVQGRAQMSPEGGLFSSQRFFLAKYGDIPLKDAILRYINELETIEQRYTKNLDGLFSFPINNLASLKIKAENGRITSLELKILINEGFSPELYSVFFNHQDKYANETTKKVENNWKNRIQEISTEELKRILTNEFENLQEEKRKESERVDKKKEHAIDICVIKYHRNMAKYPTVENIDDLEKTAFAAKNHFIDKMRNLEGISPQSKATIVEKLGKIRFQMPFSKREFERNFMRLLDDKIENARRQNLSRDKIDPKKTFTIWAYFALFPNDTDEEEEEDLDGEITEICKSMDQDAFSDATLVASGDIQLAYTLAKGPEYYQRQVIYHELGHNLQAMLEQEGISRQSLLSFEETKSCVGDVQQYVSQDKFEQFISEDFADWMSFKIEDSFSKPKGCENLYQDDNGIYEEYSVMRGNIKDDTFHSSLIFRILRYYAAHKRPLPRSCEDALIGEGLLTGLEYQCGFFPKRNIRNSADGR